MTVVDHSFGIHITWTTYASRLPGDERSYVSNTYIPGKGYVRKQNTPGMPYTSDSPATRERARKLQKWDTVYLDAEDAFVVAEALVAAAKKNGWHIPRAAVIANHVHAVVINCPADGPAIRRVLKGNAYAALTEHRGKPLRWWTTGGSDRQKHGEHALLTAIEYVANQDGKLGEVIEMKAYRCRENAGPRENG